MTHLHSVQFPSKTLFRRAAALLLAAALLPAAGCAGRSDVSRGNKHAATENWDEAVLHYAKAAAENPKNMQFRMKLMRARIKAAQVHVERGKRYQQAALYRQAAEEYQQALAFDPTHQFAADELAKTLRYMEEEATKRGGITIDEMKAEAAKAQATPRLHPQANIPIKIKFADQDIKDIFTALCKAAGLNVLFDSTVTDRKISVDLQDITFLQAMEILGIQTGTFYKVIDPYTIIIAPDNRQKRTEYEDQVIKTFYLSNASVKDVFALLRGLIDARNIAQNDQLNAITIKDSPDKVAVAERIIRSNDKAKGEVVIEVELLEVNRNKSLDFGLTHPTTGTLGFAPITPGTDTGTGTDVKGIRLHEMDLLTKQHNWLVGPLPSVSYQMFKSVSDARVLAQPHLRVTEGEKAQVHIGTQEPVPTTTFQLTTQTTTPVTNYSYQSVGIKIQVEARVHHNQEVTMKVQVEISSIVGRIDTSVGTQPIIGTRTIDTTIRLMDGQVNVLAGLIQENERDSLSGLPGVVDTPILKRLFGKTGKSKTQTDIVLSLKPNIIRMPNITTDDLKPVWIGSGERIRLMEEQPPTPAILMGKGEDSASSAQRSPRRGEEAQRTDTPARQPARQPQQQAAPAETPQEPPAASAPSRPVGPANVSLLPNNIVLEKDETMEIEIRIENAQGVMHAPLTLAYNPSVLNIVEVSEGGFLRAQGQNVTFVQNVDNEKGSVVIGYSVQEGEAASGGGVLARLTVHGVAPGISAIAMSKVELKSADGQPIAAKLSHGRVHVSEP